MTEKTAEQPKKIYVRCKKCKKQYYNATGINDDEGLCMNCEALEK